MHIYAFGSICRGEMDDVSDVDLLTIVAKNEPKPNQNVFSVYSYNRIEDLWRNGNPFSWHLYKEAKLIYASNGTDFLKTNGEPSPYDNCVADCSRFALLFNEAYTAYKSRPSIFELSVIFLAMRNFATCFALGYLNKFEFSRRAAQNLGEFSVEIPETTHRTLERARILASRGKGISVTAQEISSIAPALVKIELWLEKLSTLIYIENE